MFEIGTVLKLFVHDTTPPKVKYCIIVGVCSSDIATIFINSGLRPEHLPNGIQLLQLPVTTTDLPELKYDSIVDCSEIAERNKNELNTILQKEPGRKVRALSKNKVEEIVRLVKNAKTISTAQKKKFNLI